jgi:hypothetical protein
MHSLTYAGWSMRTKLRTLPRIVFVQNLHQEVRMHNNDLIMRQRELRFEEEEIWSELPESTREHCRTLWRQLLANVLKTGERRQNERED